MNLRIFTVFILMLLVGAVSAQNNALTFDGVDDNVAIGDLSSSIGTTYTAEAWIYPTTLTSTNTDRQNYGYTVMASSTVANSYPLWITVYGTEVRVWTFENTSASYRQTTGANLAVNQWFHIAVTTTKSGNTTVYVNGISKLSFTNDGEGSWNSIFSIGALRPVRTVVGGAGNLAFAGIIDEVRLWNVVRSQSDILNNMSTEINPSSTGLVGYWQLNEASGPTAYDSASPPHNGNVQNAGTTNPTPQWTQGIVVTLPVELSSFTALPTNQYFIQLHWVTQSETDVMGYYVHRGSDNQLANAVVVSPMIGATNSSSQVSYDFVDEDVSPGTWYYWLQSIDLDGSESFHGPIICTLTIPGEGGVPDLPIETLIKAAYPNPFNPLLYVDYSIAIATNVGFSIYNARGQLMHSFNEGFKDVGDYRLTWNGTDSNGAPCPAGIYMVRMTAGKTVSQSKVVLSK
jgi:hypothetical protein